MTTIESKKLGIKIELDASQIFPDDPGQGTPVLVELASGNTGSWNCVTCEGECDGEYLNDDQRAWLEEKTPQVENWMRKHNC